ncbi:MAG: alpha/beta hydrolase fold domain-containing protein [Pseudomonadales bacterium]|nr:alpha/beta hydrolase [Gammaproteobacteria bacterium]NNL57636.1 alpha/beta hydrolase fold domain-containing protein [Pseudomonadales bacterium]
MIWLLLIALVGLPVFTRKVIKGADLRRFDRPVGEWFDTTETDTQGQHQVKARLAALRVDTQVQQGWRARLAALRDITDRLSDDLEFDGEVLPVQQDGIDGEWVIAAGADRDRRALVLHGGAFAIGTARGHRRLAAQVSMQTRSAVLTINYRLFPEYSRDDSIADSHAAYYWLLEHGPDGAAPARQALLVGDSAGGNLVLELSAWLRDQRPQQPGLMQPAAVVAISPTVDSTLSGPSIIYNTDTDILLGDVGRLVHRLPHGLLVWLSTLFFRMHLPKPRYSPVFGDLAGLPPTLVHASDSEILFSDAIRYTNKAQRAGSPVQLQIWRDQMHDWHLLGDGLQAHSQAWQEIGKFVARHTG